MLKTDKAGSVGRHLPRREDRRVSLNPVTARWPFCEAVHPIPGPESVGRTFDCACGAVALLCAPSTEPETSVHLAEMGLSDTKADTVDGTLSIVWGREWWRREEKGDRFVRSPGG